MVIIITLSIEYFAFFFASMQSYNNTANSFNIHSCFLQDFYKQLQLVADFLLGLLSSEFMLYKYIHRKCDINLRVLIP